MLGLNFSSIFKKGGGSQLIGLDIGSYWVKVLELDLTRTDREVKGLVKKELPPEMRQGERDPKAVAEVIKACLTEGSISAKDVVIMVSGPQVFIRRITMPPMPQEELAEVIPFEATKHVSFSVEQLALDYIIVGEKEVDGVKNQDILLVAIPKDVVEQQKSIVRAAGLRPVAVTVAPMVLWKTLQLGTQKPEEKVVAMLDIGCERTTIALLNNRLLEFTRTIKVSGDEVTRSIMAVPLVKGGGEGSLRTLTYKEAEDIKQEYGFPSSTETGTTREGISLNQLSILMRPVLEKLLDEVRTSFNFYVAEFHIPRVDKIIMSGGGATLKGLREFLASELGIEVELANPFQGVEFAGGISKDDIVDIAPAFVMPFGLASWEKGDLSLLRKKAKKKDLSPAMTLIAPAGLAILLVFYLYWTTSSELANLRAELDKKVKELKSLSAISAAAITLSKKKREMQAELDSFPHALKESIDSARVLEEIRLSIPDNTRLEQIDVVHKRRKAGKKIIDIWGTAFFLDERGPSMSNFMAALEESPIFDDVRMILVEEDKSYTVNGLKFQLSCQYNPLVP
ncbi:MAG: Competence protein A [Candidatus Scalindua rubra]|uniref:Competence protein A n=1 Tax=Candidatus Scalindua rubra TaxID=1872076 RepID=A0A1E3XCE4_9BACT|nr:MAG: Competence protein A [Candidatus Scalindua rubra]